MALNSITFANKSDINSNSSVADTNKIKAADVNEIKTVVNAAVTQVNNMTGSILWTNSSPTASFASQSITLSSSNYDILEIFYYDYTTNQRLMSQRVVKGKGTNLVALFDYNSKMYMGERKITYTNATQLSVGSCTSIIDNNAIAVATANQWCVPVYVVGYKTGLF